MSTFPSMQEFLDQVGVLEKGSKEEILAAKKEYRKQYKRWHKKQRRQTFKEFHPAFSPDEVSLLKKEAKGHGLSITNFIKQSTLAYINQVFLLPAPDQVARLDVVLNQCYQAIKQAEERPGGERVRNLNLLRTIVLMEQKISKIFRNPNLLEDAIQMSLQKDPGFRDRLQTILKENDYANYKKY